MEQVQVPNSRVGSNDKLILTIFSDETITASNDVTLSFVDADADIALADDQFTVEGAAPSDVALVPMSLKTISKKFISNIVITDVNLINKLIIATVSSVNYPQVDGIEFHIVPEMALSSDSVEAAVVSIQQNLQTVVTSQATQLTATKSNAALATSNDESIDLQLASLSASITDLADNASKSSRGSAG